MTVYVLWHFKRSNWNHAGGVIVSECGAVIVKRLR